MKSSNKDFNPNTLHVHVRRGLKSLKDGNYNQFSEPTEITNKLTILGKFLLVSHQGWLSISTVGKLKLNIDH